MAYDYYAGERVAYMNARRAAKPGTGSGGTNYAKVNRTTEAKRAVDERSRLASLDLWEETMERVDAIWAEFRAWVREGSNTLRSRELMGCKDDDFPF